MDRPLGPWGRRITIYGRVPLFYYVLHLLLIHAVAVALAWPTLGSGRADACVHAGGRSAPSAAGVYGLWIAIVVALYPACRWFAGVKRRSRAAWMSYL